MTLLAFRACSAALALAAVAVSPLRAADASHDLAALAIAYENEIRPLLARYCHKCHREERSEADIDLAALGTLEQVREDPRVWQRAREMLDSAQMPPKKARQPSDAERARLRAWVRAYLTAEARARAGDPGRVVLRRLSNSEYTYTVRDLTGIDSLRPTREFPVDGAAGEGFTNTGGALVMSPSLVTKYLDAAKGIARHAVLVPDGMHFSEKTTRRDWTDEMLARIRAFYREYTEPGGRETVRLQGIELETASGGQLAIDEYLAATVAEREALRAGDDTAVESLARERGLNAKYLGILWRALSSTSPSMLLGQLRARWRVASEGDVSALVDGIHLWQKSLWKLNSIGHLGRAGGPRAWMEPVTPIVDRRDFAVDLPEAPGGDLVLRFVANVAGDGESGGVVVWSAPRLEGGGRPPLALRDVAGLARRCAELRRDALAASSRYLAAVAEARADSGVVVDLESLARRHEVDPAILQSWLDWLAIGRGGPVDVRGHFREKMTSAGAYTFVKGWGTTATPSIAANSSDQEVRIPGIARPHGVVAHPSPSVFAAVGWTSPVDGVVSVEAHIADAHPECGNGVEWIVEHRSGRRSIVLARGDFGRGGKAVTPSRIIAVARGELVSLIIGPRRGEHTCDLTAVDLRIVEAAGEQRVWDLSGDVNADILAANPHADGHGKEAVWHFYKGEMASIGKPEETARTVPAGSLLSGWRDASDPGERERLARDIEKLAIGPAPVDSSSPDALLHAALRAMPVSFDDAALLSDVERDSRFGAHPRDANADVDSADLVVEAPSVVELRVPAELAAGRRLVAVGRLDPLHGREGIVQLDVRVNTPAGEELTELDAHRPVVVAPEGVARDRVESAMKEFRELFPLALCYERIVPVDEVVTLTLYYRQDDALARLMLDEDETARLDRLWDELLYVAREPLALVTAYEQIYQFATQDRPDLVKAFEPLRPKIAARAEAFRRRLVATEPSHVEAVLDFANRAWRRPLTDVEREGLRALYRRLRDEEIAHEDAIRLTIARVLTAPAFLYRLEQPGPGAGPSPVSPQELATRLSSFLWSSMPDDELRRVADRGELVRTETLRAQALRMLDDDRTRRLAVEFACQWLGIRDFDENDEKNEKLYPEFAALRGAMYEEAVRFFEDMFRHDNSVLGLLEADHGFLDARLARHYGIDGVEDGTWRRVDGLRARGRGGVLAMAAVLAKQSGASRTSPILRGNWVSETLLGERLPRPPPNVPQLPDAVPEGLTARELIERHSSVPECARCHAKIDPYGFALEQYDAIGRLRPRTVDTRTTLADGKSIAGIDGLREYLATDRLDAVLAQFCRKLLGFALGRAVQLSDEPLLTEMREALRANDYRFGVAVEKIVTSRQFRDIRGAEAADEP